MLTITGDIKKIIFALWLAAFCIAMHADSPMQRRSNTRPHCTFELTMSKQEVFLEERVPFKIRLTFDQQAYAINNIITPNVAGILFEPLSSARKGQDIINGVSCFVYEWSGVLFPQKIGTVTIEAFQAAGEQRTSEVRGFFSMFTSNSVVFTSNACSLRVQPLPGRTKGGAPIGDFNEVHLDAERTNLSAGEAIVVRYHVKGLGNLNLCKHPHLQVPEGLKSYPAELKKEQGGYCFEYAVQAVQDGIFVIPSQMFKFFDPEKRLYRELPTESIRLYVDPSKKIITPLPEPQENAVDASDELEPQAEVPTYSVMRNVALPNYLFIMLVLLGLLWCAIRSCGDFFGGLWQRFVVWHERRKLLNRARATIVAAKKLEDIASFYDIFKELQSVVDWDNVQKTDVKKHGAWHVFWGRVEALRFTTDRVDEFPEDVICEARDWITYFEKMKS